MKMPELSYTSCSTVTVAKSQDINTSNEKLTYQKKKKSYVCCINR